MNSQQSTETWMSIYVPCIPPDMMLDGKAFATVEDVTDFFENKLCIGKVKRVDLITKPRGQTHILASFVHFDCWYRNSEKMREFMDGPGNGECKLYGYSKQSGEDEPAEHSGFYSSQNRKFGRYLTCKINKSPIPEIEPMAAAELNVHQLVHALEVARETMAQNEKLLAEQTRRIAELEAILYKCEDSGPIVADSGPIVADSSPITIDELATPDIDVSGNEYMRHNKSSYA